MPIYEYECENCSHRFELIQKFSDPPIKQCPLCKGEVRKIISSPGIMFKGSGWYVTDYSNKLKGSSDEVKTVPEKNEGKAPEKKEKEPSKEASAPPPPPAPTPSDKKTDI